MFTYIMNEHFSLSHTIYKERENDLYVASRDKGGMCTHWSRLPTGTPLG